MITVRDIDLELRRIEKSRIATVVSKKDIKEYTWFRAVKMYLETNPDEDFCKKKLQELESLVKRICDREDKYSTGKKKAEYLELHRVPEMKEQIRVLKYILNK